MESMESIESSFGQLLWDGKWDAGKLHRRRPKKPWPFAVQATPRRLPQEPNTAGSRLCLGLAQAVPAIERTLAAAKVQVATAQKAEQARCWKVCFARLVGQNTLDRR